MTWPVVLLNAAVRFAVSLSACSVADSASWNTSRAWMALVAIWLSSVELRIADTPMIETMKIRIIATTRAAPPWVVAGGRITGCCP